MPMEYFKEIDRIESYSPVVYAKGGLFYEDLRKTIGDEAFFKAVAILLWLTLVQHCHRGRIAGSLPGSHHCTPG